MSTPVTVSAAEVAAFINWLGAEYYFDGTPNWLWDEALELRERQYFATEPGTPINVRNVFSGAAICTSRDGVDPRKIEGEEAFPVFERWFAVQTSTIVAFRIPKEKLAEAVALLVSLGAERQ